MNIIKFQEDMVYNNLFNRLLFSILLLVLYVFSLLNFYFLATFGILIYTIIFFEIFKFFKKNIIIISIYLLVSFVFFLLYLYNSFDFKYFNILIFTIICFDSSCYVFGVTFGRNKVYKYISPNKTYEGYVGGFIFTNLSFILCYYFFLNLQNFFNFLILLNIIIIFSLFGDILQSYFKRLNNIKDSSNFLPGHGGFFDRFDSFISSIIFLSLYSYIFL